MAKLENRRLCYCTPGRYTGNCWECTINRTVRRGVQSYISTINPYPAKVEKMVSS